MGVSEVEEEEGRPRKIMKENNEPKFGKKHKLTDSIN